MVLDILGLYEDEDSHGEESQWLVQPPNMDLL